MMSPEQIVLPDAPELDLGVDLATHHEISQFLFLESRLLDERRYEEWYRLFTEDVLYWMPTRYNRLLREIDSETAVIGQAAHFEDDHQMLWQRVVRLRSGMAWSEDPPSRARHLVTNISAHHREVDEEFDVTSYFLTYRTRGDSEWDMWVGRRDDVLRRVGEHTWRIARRKITIDQATILSKNLSVFF